MQNYAIDAKYRREPDSNNVGVSHFNYFQFYEPTITALDKWFASGENDREMNRVYYESKPMIDVFVTNEYTHWTAWAHTVPEERAINIRPYDHLGIEGVFNHEVYHNINPHEHNEDHVTQAGNGPLSDYFVKSFRYRFH
jgi:hypothetical protein